jgi:hypothetical protein
MIKRDNTIAEKRKADVGLKPLIFGLDLDPAEWREKVPYVTDAIV